MITPNHEQPCLIEWCDAEVVTFSKIGRQCANGHLVRRDSASGVLDVSPVVSLHDWLAAGAAKGPEVIWGYDGQVLWARGESLTIIGEEGTGKSTLAQQLALARIGVTSSLLGFPIVSGSGTVLYMAHDRPDQIRRSLMRMLTDGCDRVAAEQGIVIYPGPPRFDAEVDPRALADLAAHRNADTVIIDSTKDFAGETWGPKGGETVNRAVQNCLAQGIEVINLHHPRKKGQGESQRRIGLDDSMGGRAITSGSGSVFALEGAPGAATVRLTHLKNPADLKVGPLALVHDHRHGRTTVSGQGLWELLALHAATGVTSQDAALARGECQPDAAEPVRRKAVEKLRRELDRLVADGKATKQEGARGGPGGSSPARYFPAEANTGQTHA